MTLIDRSRIIAFQTCPRKRFLEYHWGGTGLQRKAKALPLQFGSAFHEGCPDLLTGDVETAVYCAMKYLADAFKASGVAFDGEESSDAAKAMQYGMEEQCALAEALLRGWWAYEGERFLRDFEVLEVEKEGRATLKHGANYNLIKSDPANDVQKAEGVEWVDYYSAVGSDPEIVLMFRPDALVRERETGNLYVVSWKTRASHGKRSVEQDKHDMQSISEVWGVEATYPNDYETQAKIEGVLYKVIVKGKRMLDDWDGLWKQQTHLIYGWVKRGAQPAYWDKDAQRIEEPGDGNEWSWAYAWDDESELNAKTGKPVNHKLGKGWRKVPIWRDYPGGVKAWVEGLAANQIFPRHKNALEQVFPQAMPVERRADEIESWKRQVIAQETEVAYRVSVAEVWKGRPEEYAATILDAHFPQYTHSCSAYSGCPMADICWNPEIGRDLIGSALYVPRLSNHPEATGDDE